jgi:hypothetical protein
MPKLLTSLKRRKPQEEGREERLRSDGFKVLIL